MISSILQFLQGNSLATGGLLVMAGGMIFGILRSWPLRAWAYVVQHVMYEMEVANSDESFFWLESWLMRHVNLDKMKRFRLASSWMESEDRHEEHIDRKFSLIPGRGDHLFRYNGHWVWATCSNENLIGTGGVVVEPRKINLRAFRGSRKWLQTLVEEAQTEWYGREPNLIKVYVPREWDWKAIRKREGRMVESLVYDDAIYERVYADMARFFNEEEWYKQMGIPHRRGYLFFGPPGNGKTSICEALACAFGKDVASLSIGGKDMSDEKLVQLLGIIPSSAVLCLEDFDSVFHGRVNVAKSHLTFTGLLNALDGFTATERRIVLMTTNHIENLDPALMRPGRVDVKQYIGNATKDQARRMFLRFFPESPDLATQFADVVPEGVWSMAELQEHLLRYRETDLGALNEFTQKAAADIPKLLALPPAPEPDEPDETPSDPPRRPPRRRFLSRKPRHK